MPLPLPRGRAQASLEVLVLVAVGLSLLLLVISQSQEQLTETQSVLTYGLARSEMERLARSVDEVWLEGEGARRRLRVQFPEGTVGSAVGNRFLNLQVGISGGVTDAPARTNADIVGSLPSRPGVYYIIVEAKEGFVQVGLQALGVTPTLLHVQAVGQNSTQLLQRTVTYSNTGNESLNVSLTVNFTASGVTVLLANPLDSTFELLPSGTKSVTLNFSIGASVVGVFTGTLEALANNSDSAPVDLVVEVTGFTGPPPPAVVTNETVSFFEITTWTNATRNVEKLVFGPDEAVVLRLGAPIIPSEVATVSVFLPNGTSLAGYPKNVSTDDAGNLQDYFLLSSGSALGTYTVFINQSGGTGNTTFNVIDGCSA
jgi:hypothetical protein